MQIKKFVEQKKLPYLFLDSGGLLFKQKSIRSEREKQEKIAAQGIAKAMQAMNCRAVGIAARDLAGGIDLLKKIEQEQKLTWLSMNIVDSETKKTIFTSSITIEVAGLSIAVIGITDKQMASEADMKQSGYTVLPWQDVLPKVVDRAGNKADMIILLSSYSHEENKKIAKTAKDIDLILASGHSAATVYPSVIDNALFAQTGARGKYLGMLHIDWTEANSWGQDGITEIRIKQNRLDRINWQIKQMEKRKGKKDLSADKHYKKLNREKKQVKAKIKKLRGKKKAKGAEFCSFINHSIALQSSLPEDPDVRRIINRTTREVNALDKKRTIKKTGRELASLAGWQECAKCHAEQAAFWQAGRHAQSVQTLKKDNRQFNEDCLICHVTLPYYDAARVKAERLLLNLPEPLKNVGCESCHGPGAVHAENPISAKIIGQPPEHTCKGCHTPEHDDNFIFAEKVKKVRCPKR